MSRDDPSPRGRPILYHWTPERTEALIARVKARDLAKTIAFDLGWPTHAVTAQIEKLRREGRLPPPARGWTRREEAALIAARDGGGRWDMLAPIFGRSAQALRQRAMRVRRRMRAEAEQAGRDQFTLELRAA
jgi:hypothetical protein